MLICVKIKRAHKIANATESKDEGDTLHEDEKLLEDMCAVARPPTKN